MTVFEFSLRDTLQSWPLYRPADHVQIVAIPGGQSIQYCGKFDGTPFSPAMHHAPPDPPNLLTINILDGILYLLFIQVEPDQRGKGHGNQLYKLVCEYAWRMKCREVRQTPSGGYHTEDRLEYLTRRGWVPDGVEVVWPIELESTVIGGEL